MHKNVFLSEVAAFRKAVPSKGRGLEIGVGTGRFAEALNISDGIDPSENMLKIAAKRGIKTFIGKGERLPFKDKSYDYVLLSITLCFLKKPDEVIKEAGRVLRGGGKLIAGIIDRNSHLGKLYGRKKNRGHKFYEKAMFYSPKQVIKFMKDNGFVNIRSYQTIFQDLGDMKIPERPEKGYGKGGFAVLCGQKS
ncbi:MAG: class I SAM-dependent methyltransferase [Endomicrobiales bacterium]|nr:class I SAM-dependent methyltransferase [Endomicrobiales bacterium]